MVADTNYDTPAPPPNNAPPLRGLVRAGAPAVLVAPGGKPPQRCCGSVLNREDWPPLGTDQSTARDLLLFLPVETSKRVENLRTSIAGEGGLDITAAPDALVQTAPHLEERVYPNESGPTRADGQHIASGWVARIPVSVNPTHPWDIGGDRYPLAISATYDVAGESQPHTLTARAALDAQVASGIYEMGLAASVLPLVCVGAAFARWRQTR
jgi:hypothetical protein